MKIQIHHIPSSGLKLTFEEAPERFASVKALMDSGECGFTAPVRIALEVTPMPDMIRVKGGINAAAGLTCVRCLKTYDHRLESSFTLDYTKVIIEDLHRDDDIESVELTAQQIGMMHYQGDEIDFTDAIQEQIVLTVPYRPLCSDACKGLCARCGSDLNVDTCRCSDQAAEGPFDVLKQLKLPTD